VSSATTKRSASLAGAIRSCVRRWRRVCAVSSCAWNSGWMANSRHVIVDVIGDRRVRFAAPPRPVAAKPAGGQRSQRRRQKSLDEWLLQSTQFAIVKMYRWLSQNRFGRRALLCPKPALRGFTKAMDPRLEQSHPGAPEITRVCVTGELPPIASEPTPSPRLWAASPGATRAKLCEQYHEVSLTKLKTGTFYFGESRNFLFWSDTRLIRSSSLSGTDASTSTILSEACPSPYGFSMPTREQRNSSLLAIPI
jgi:hypothetical protein